MIKHPLQVTPAVRTLVDAKRFSKIGVLLIWATDSLLCSILYLVECIELSRIKPMKELRKA